MKILQVADEHIRERDADEIDRCLQFIVDTAQKEHPNLILSCGDLFDSRDVRVDSRAAITAIGFVSALMDVAPVAIVLGTPSHDGAAPRIMQYVRGDYPVIVAEKPMQVVLSGGEFKTEADNEGYGLQAEAVITLIPQPTKQYWQTQAGVSGSDQEIGAAMTGVFGGFGAEAAQYPGVPHILVYHGGISGARVSTGQTLTGHDIEVSTDQLALTGADIYCLGHIHMAQQIGDRGFYAGSPYRTNIGEAEAKGFYLHEYGKTVVNGNSYWESSFIETPARKVVRIADDYRNGVGQVPLEMPDVNGADVRYELTVWQDEADRINKEEVVKGFTDHGALSVDIRITRIPRETVRAESVLKAKTLRQKIEERARITGEEVPAGVLDLADLLQGSEAERLLKSVMGGGV